MIMFPSVSRCTPLEYGFCHDKNGKGILNYHRHAYHLYRQAEYGELHRQERADHLRGIVHKSDIFNEDKKFG